MPGSLPGRRREHNLRVRPLLDAFARAHIRGPVGNEHQRPVTLHSVEHGLGAEPARRQRAGRAQASVRGRASRVVRHGRLWIRLRNARPRERRHPAMASRKLRRSAPGRPCRSRARCPAVPVQTLGPRLRRVPGFWIEKGSERRPGCHAPPSRPAVVSVNYSIEVVCLRSPGQRIRTVCQRSVGADLAEDGCTAVRSVRVRR